MRGLPSSGRTLERGPHGGSPRRARTRSPRPRGRPRPRVRREPRPPLRAAALGRRAAFAAACRSSGCDRAVILVNAVFAFVQEYRAERAVAALRGMLPSRVACGATARRSRSPARRWFPATSCCSRRGPRRRGRRPARRDRSARRRVDADRRVVPGRPAEQVFAGTFVTAGTGEALVTATGMATRFGRIAELAQRTRRERSPLERELDRVTRLVAVLAVSDRRPVLRRRRAEGDGASPTGSCSRSGSWSRSSPRGCCRP